MARSVLDYINTMMEAERRMANGELSYQEWCDIRRNGTPEEIEEAVLRMEAQGGYENLV